MTDYIVTCDEETAEWIGNEADSMQPIVRCEDCEFFDTRQCKSQWPFRLDGFCAWGERERQAAMTDKPIRRTKTAKSVPLLLCPFCGGEARLMAQHFTDDSHIYWVGCRKCGMEGPHMHDGEPAIVAWSGMVKERTCHEAMIDKFFRGCDSCGWMWEVFYGIGKCERPSYCPNCGAKVVDE